MKREELEKLKMVEKVSLIITPDDLSNTKDRTLLYGYTCERDTWHVYLSGGGIFTVVYSYNGEPHQVAVHTNHDYVPDKRLYPERCDYEFCKLLKKEGVYLPFTTYSEHKFEEGVYYGEVL